MHGALVQYRLGSVAARCPRCDGTYFRELIRTTVRLGDTLECMECAAQFPRHQLLQAICEEVSRVARTRLDEARLRRHLWRLNAPADSQ